MTFIWNVDDLKVLHMDQHEITKIKEYLQSIYGKMTVTHGKGHNYDA